MPHLSTLRLPTTFLRLYEKGMIDNPVGKAKSIALTDEGLARSEALFEQYFGKK